MKPLTVHERFNLCTLEDNFGNYDTDGAFKILLQIKNGLFESRDISGIFALWIRSDLEVPIVCNCSTLKNMEPVRTLAVLEFYSKNGIESGRPGIGNSIGLDSNSVVVWHIPPVEALVPECQ